MRALILGAGFSRAISNRMPTMTDLVASIADVGDIDVDELRRFGSDLEQWLSFLSVDQPWLTDDENHRNRAAFIRLTREIHRQISDAESRVICTSPPDWLLRFAWAQAEAMAPIFTFNYDTLLERAIAVLNRIGTWTDLYGAPLTTRSAPAGGMSFGVSAPRGPIPSIYKMHGSVNWAFGGLDAPPNDPIVLTSDQLSWVGESASDVDRAPRYRHMFDDLTPLLVPPTFSKGPYFANRSLKAQWRYGAGLLAQADEIVVAGYSFPPGDLVARQWIATSARPALATVVDPDPSVVDRVSKLLGESVPVTYFDSLAAYVETICGPIIRWRVYLDKNESLGLQIDLHVGTENLFESIDRSAPPWNAFDGTAHLWLGALLEGLFPGAEDKAAIDDYPHDRLRGAKHVVTPLGWQVNRGLLAERLRHS